MPVFSRSKKFHFSIAINWGDKEHPPPHFHVIQEGKTVARFLIKEGVFLEVDVLSSKAKRHIQIWNENNKTAILENWNKAQNHQSLVEVPFPI